MPTPGGSPVIEHGGFYTNANLVVAISSGVGTLDEDDDNLTEFVGRYCKVTGSDGRLTLGKGRWKLEFEGNLLASTNALTAQFAKNGTVEGPQRGATSVATIGVPISLKHIVEVDNGDYVTLVVGNSTGDNAVTVLKGATLIATCLESYAQARQGKNS